MTSSERAEFMSRVRHPDRDHHDEPVRVGVAGGVARGDLRCELERGRQVRRGRSVHTARIETTREPLVCAGAEIFERNETGSLGERRRAAEDESEKDRRSRNESFHHDDSLDFPLSLPGTRGAFC